MTYKNLLSMYSRLRISTENEKLSFSSKTSVKVYSPTSLYSGTFKAHVFPSTCIPKYSSCHVTVIRFAVLGKSADVNTYRRSLKG